MLTINKNSHFIFINKKNQFSELKFAHPKSPHNPLHIKALTKSKPFEILKFNHFQGIYREFLKELL